MAKKNNPGCNCCGSSVCSVTMTCVFRGCGSPYTDGGTYTIRRKSDGLLFYSGTLPASGSETITFTPPVALSVGQVYQLTYFPDYPRFGSFVGAEFPLFCGDQGTLTIDLSESAGFMCCASSIPPVPKTLYLTDNAGTTTLTQSGGVELTGSATISTTGVTTGSGCTTAATVTVEVLYHLKCSSFASGPSYLYPMGQLERRYSYCQHGTTLAHGFRDKDDNSAPSLAVLSGEVVNASSAPTIDPFFGTYPDDSFGILGTATVTE